MPAKNKPPQHQSGSAAPAILSLSSFGDFERELKLAFKNAFGFSWDFGEDSPEEAERRRAFGPALTAVRIEPIGPPRALQLMKECYDLQLKLTMFIVPHEVLRDELAEIIATIAHTGEQFRRMLGVSPDPESNGNLHAGSAALREVSDRWTAIEDWLRAEQQVTEQERKESETKSSKAVSR